MAERWTHGRCEILREMWAQGASVGEIARRVGRAKSAVIGKARRMGLGPHPAKGTGRGYFDVETGDISAQPLFAKPDKMIYEAIREAAANGEACPTNLDLAARLGYVSGGNIARRIKILEEAGLIKVERYLHHRIVTVIETGQSTAQPDWVRTPGKPVARGGGRPRSLPINDHGAQAKRQQQLRKDVGLPVRPLAITPLAKGPAPKTCQWPIGDPRQPRFRFCNEPVVEGKPYCAKHCAKAYVACGAPNTSGVAA